MSTITRDIFFRDEAPTVGSGLRTVLAVVGHKWVRVKSAAPGSEQFFSRLKRSIWDDLAASTDAMAARSAAAAGCSP